MKRSGLRGIPSVDKLARALSDTGLPHPTVVATIRREYISSSLQLVTWITGRARWSKR
jgi:hypothetical protein